MIPNRGSRGPNLALPADPQPTSPWHVIQGAPAAAAGPRWSAPIALNRQLQRLSTQPEAAAWATATLAAIDSFTSGMAAPDADAELQLAQLGRRADEARQLAAEARQPELQIELLRAHYALIRRIDCWSAIHAHRVRRADVPHARLDGESKLSACLDRFKQLTDDSTKGHGWRDYLLIRPLTQTIDGTQRLTPSEQRQLAREILARMSTSRLTSAQRRFVASAPLAAIGDELRHWAAEAVDLGKLQDELESYEQMPGTELARVISDQQRRLAWSPPSPVPQARRTHRTSLSQRQSAHHGEARIARQNVAPAGGA